MSLHRRIPNDCSTLCTQGAPFCFHTGHTREGARGFRSVYSGSCAGTSQLAGTFPNNRALSCSGSSVSIYALEQTLAFHISHTAASYAGGANALLGVTKARDSQQQEQKLTVTVASYLASTNFNMPTCMRSGAKYLLRMRICQSELRQ